MTDGATSAKSLPNAAVVGARIERLPFTPFHMRALLMIGAAHFFDAFDALAIAFVLPALVIRWHLDPVEAGVVATASFVGQALGSVALGWASERWGRLRVVAFTCWLIGLFALACTQAWSAASFMALRFAQGIGLGGEVPAGATYVNEICSTRLRSRMVYAVQILFGAATACTAAVAVWLVPRFGWQSMFFAGGLPLLLATFLRRVLPESPRWLAANGRVAEATAILDRIEVEHERRHSTRLPPLAPVVATALTTEVTGLSTLLSAAYVVRTLNVWMLTFSLSFGTYCILVWMPTLYTTVFKLPVQQALTYGAVGNAMALGGAIVGAFLVDRFGRRTLFSVCLLGSSLPLFLLARMAEALSALEVAVLSSAAFGFMAVLLPAIYVYAAEIYPTRLRGIGSGCAIAWMRVAAIVGPALIGVLLKHSGIGAAFLLIGTLPMVGAVMMFLFGIETRGRPLDDAGIVAPQAGSTVTPADAGVDEVRT